MSNLRFRKYTPEDAAAFKALNIEWLDKFFVVEPIDEEVLSHPKKAILDKGGHIIMAEIDSELIGNFAFIKKEDKLFEFSKMAIAPLHRGKGFGNTMMQFAIQFAEQHHWNKIILYSSRRLENSIHIYRKYGFLEVELESNSHYARSDIKMELIIS